MRSVLLLGTIAVISVGTLVGLVGMPSLGRLSGASSAQEQKKENRGSVAVESAVARQVTVSTDLRAIGSLQSDETVQIASEIAGRVGEIAFKEGEQIAEGQVIIKLDDALAKAEVADTQARYELANANLGRARTLSRTGNVTEKAQDEAVANFETARAAVDLAKVKLDKHTIRAPFTGRLGMRKVSVGAYMSVGAPIVNLEKIDVLKVDFKLPEIHLADIKVGQPIDVVVDALPGRTFTGEIYALDPMMDVNGRALQIRARLPNPNLVLRPGLFARILVKGSVEQKVLVVPESAIVPRGGESFVFRIENGRAVEAKVSLGVRRNAEVQILGGLAADATVVTAGQLKLRNGSPVEIIAQGAPPNRDPAIKRGS
jgi:membrane fusion protein (multidrug efflux system)